MLIKWLRDGGFVIARASNNGWWPHFFWTADLVVFEEYTPKHPNRHLLFPPPLYDGMVKVTNAQEQRELKWRR